MSKEAAVFTALMVGLGFGIVIGILFKVLMDYLWRGR